MIKKPCVCICGDQVFFGGTKKDCIKFKKRTYIDYPNHLPIDIYEEIKKGGRDES